MENVKILELSTYAKRKNLNFNAADIYALVAHNFERTRHEKYICITELSLKKFLKIEGLSNEIRAKAQKILSILQQFINDKDYHNAKVELEKELQNIEKNAEKFFSNLKN